MANRAYAKLILGEIEYFFQEGNIRQGKSALYIGPAKSSDGIQRHITLVFDVETGDVDNIHVTRMIGQQRLKRWQIIPKEALPNLHAWIRNNSKPIAGQDLAKLGKNYYWVSAWRMISGLSIIQGIMGGIFTIVSKPLSAMGIFRFSMKRDCHKKQLRVSGNLDVMRVQTILRHFGFLRQALELVLPGLIKKAGPRIMKLGFTNSKRISKGDAALLIPRAMGLPPLVIIRSHEYLQIEAERVFEKAAELYEQIDLQYMLPDTIKPSSFQLPIELRMKNVSA